jgi:hypothetical protein
MTVTAQIGTTFESLLLSAPTGLVGSMSWGLMNPVTGVYLLGPRTIEITEPTPGTYVTTDTAPLTPGEYLMVWAYSGTSSSEDLVVQLAPIISPRYATVADLRNYSALVSDYSDDDLNTTLREAERWIDDYLPPWPYLDDTGLKLDPTTMLPQVAVQLNNAACAQGEYILHMGPGFFISGSTSIQGGDYSEQFAPKLAPKAKRHLISGRILLLTGRVSPDWYRYRRGVPYTNIPYPISGFGPWW